MCGERVQEVVDALRAAGLLGKLGVVVIGSGWPAAARGFLADLPGVDPAEARLRLLVDRRRGAYAHLRLARGVGRTFTWRKWANVKGLLLFPYECCVRRRLPGANAGDPWQQGGVFVFPGGGGEAPLLARREETPGWPALDHAELAAAGRDALAAAAAGATRGSASDGGDGARRRR